MTAPDIANSLLTWYDDHKRDLPWRNRQDPYAIWLSEVMLQQTTVKTVAPRWMDFLARWPTIHDLAKASIDDVLAQWSGLGYYARARNMHKTAKIISENYQGHFPTTVAQLKSLPGMGEYTANAVASIAFQAPVPVLDANVERVVARLIALDIPSREKNGKTRIKKYLDDALSQERPGDFNQAMMEIGATICLPKAPTCLFCPFTKICKAHQLGKEESFPILPQKTPFQKVTEISLIFSCKDEILLFQRKPNISFGGMWEIPRIRIVEGKTEKQCIDELIRAIGMRVEEKILPKHFMTLHHTVMRSRIELKTYHIPMKKKNRFCIGIEDHESGGWKSVEEWKTLPLSTTQKKIALHFCRNLSTDF